jgi:hypothetical protein
MLLLPSLLPSSLPSSLPLSLQNELRDNVLLLICFMGFMGFIVFFLLSISGSLLKVAWLPLFDENIMYICRYAYNK